MEVFSLSKRGAKSALRKNWGKAAAMLLILVAVWMLLTIIRQVATNLLAPLPAPPVDGLNLHNLQDSLPARFALTPAEWIITAACSILEFLLTVPLILGITRWFYSLVHGISLPFAEIFHFFESGRAYVRSLWYHINLWARSLLWALAFYAIPGGMIGASLYFLMGDEPERKVRALASTGIFLGLVLFLLATVFYAACMNRYALTPYLLAENDEVAVRKAIKQSVRYTRGFRFNLVWFSLTFTGWALLCCFILPALYVLPYYFAATAAYARHIIDKNRIIPDETREFSAAGQDSLPQEDAQ